VGSGGDVGLYKGLKPCDGGGRNYGGFSISTPRRCAPSWRMGSVVLLSWMKTGKKGSSLRLNEPERCRPTTHCQRHTRIGGGEREQKRGSGHPTSSLAGGHRPMAGRKLYAGIQQPVYASAGDPHLVLTGIIDASPPTNERNAKSGGESVEDLQSCCRELGLTAGKRRKPKGHGSIGA